MNNTSVALVAGLLSVLQQPQAEEARIALEPGVMETWSIELLEVGEGEQVLIQPAAGNGVRQRRTITLGADLVQTWIGENLTEMPFPDIGIDILLEVEPTETPGVLGFALTTEAIDFSPPEDLTISQAVALGGLKVQYENLVDVRLQWFRGPDRAWLSEKTLKLLEESKLGTTLMTLPLLDIAPVFPAEPIGVGARWTVHGKRNTSSFRFVPANIVYEYEIEEIASGRIGFTVEKRVEGRDIPVDSRAVSVPNAESAKMVELRETWSAVGRVSLRTGLLEGWKGEGTSFSDLTFIRGGQPFRFTTSSNSARVRMGPRVGRN